MADLSLGSDVRAGIDRAAILLLTLGEREAAMVLKNLPAKLVQKLGAAMAQISDVSRDEASEVISNFITDAESQTSVGVANTEFVRNALVEALGESAAANLIDQILLGRASKGLDSLKYMEPKAVADLIRVEHPQIIAIILSQLEAAQAARILGCLPPEMHTDLLMRVATVEGIQPDALEELDAVMERQLGNATRLQAAGFAGPKIVADIVNFLEPRIESTVMRELKEADPELGAKIQDLVFVFDNLIEVDDRSMQELLRQVSSDKLLLAIKGADDRLRDKIFSNMSQRAAEMLRDDLEAALPVKLSEVENAQREILEIARRLSDEGTITLGARGGETYV
jgi:flagellar motor switch protein FliG